VAAQPNFAKGDRIVTELNYKMTRALAMSTAVFVKAIAVTHPDPTRLRAAFETLSEQFIASLLGGETDDVFLRAAQLHLEDLRQHIRPAE